MNDPQAAGVLARRSAKFQESVGSGGRAKVRPGRQGQMVFEIRCLLGCKTWNTFRPGQDNGYDATLDRWEAHVQAAHRRGLQ